MLIATMVPSDYIWLRWKEAEDEGGEEEEEDFISYSGGNNASCKRLIK